MKKWLVLTIMVTGLALSQGRHKVVEITPRCETVEIEVVSQNALPEEEVEGIIDGESLEWIAKCTEAEARNQDILGKRLVVDVILNRIYSKDFPDDAISVISQDGQFAVYKYGTMQNITPSEETYRAVEMELEHRIDTEIMYFASSGYISKPAYKHGGHYFAY